MFNSGMLLSEPGCAPSALAPLRTASTFRINSRLGGRRRNGLGMRVVIMLATAR